SSATAFRKLLSRRIGSSIYARQDRYAVLIFPLGSVAEGWVRCVSRRARASEWLPAGGTAPQDAFGRSGTDARSVGTRAPRARARFHRRQAGSRQVRPVRAWWRRGHSSTERAARARGRDCRKPVPQTRSGATATPVRAR